ncbi:winged helix-turn-helix domain-containing protein [Actinomadura sp. ATCC 39365]
MDGGAAAHRPALVPRGRPARRRAAAGAERVLLAVGGRDVGSVPVDARLSGARRRHAVGAGPAPAPGALAALIGRSRAQILLALAEPSTTSALAARMSLTPGAVSQHLGVLSDGGLAVGLRLGKQVVYRRTAAGDMLAGASL